MRAPFALSTSRNRTDGKPRPAVAAAVGHWGELLQGRLGAEGPVALVTLRCPSVFGRARFRPVPGAPLSVSGPLGGEIAARAARLALQALGRPDLGGRLTVDGTAAPGAGSGSSTLAALTTIRAAAGALGRAFTTEAEAALCLAVERASDPLMLDAPMRRLWASREGRTLATLPPPPPMTALGVLAGAGAPTDPDEADFEDVSDLAAEYRRAVEAGDLAAVGRVATESAERRSPPRPVPFWDAFLELGRETGAAGVARAHTGAAVALLFPPGAPGLEQAERGIEALGFPGARRFDPAAPVRKAAARG